MCFHQIDHSKSAPPADTLSELFKIISDRKQHPVPESYTCKLYEGGDNKILKKIGEEAAEVVMACKDDDPEQIIGDNQPYDGALKNDTMYQHCTTRGLAQALLEVRQDLIETESGVEDWADRLEPVLAKANLMEDMHRIQIYPSRADQKG